MSEFGVTFGHVKVYDVFVVLVMSTPLASARRTGQHSRLSSGRGLTGDVLHGEVRAGHELDVLRDRQAHARALVIKD
jgi:hypothetical protein